MASTITEDQLQAKCFQWHWNEYPEKRGTLFAVPNGGARDKITANKLKATGVVAGVSDLILLLLWKVIFIEMKTEEGTQSDDQKKWMRMAQELGHMYVLIRTFEDFQKFIKEIYE